MRLYHFTTPENALDIIEGEWLRPCVRESNHHMTAGKPVVWFTTNPSNAYTEAQVAYWREHAPTHPGCADCLREYEVGRRLTFIIGDNGCVRLALDVSGHRPTHWLMWARQRQAVTARARVEAPMPTMDEWWIAFKPVPLTGDVEVSAIDGDADEIADMIREAGLIGAEAA